MNTLRIAIADDDEGMRLVMRKIIERAEGCELVGEAESGKQMLELFDRERPDAVVLDVEMPEMDGIECAKAIQDRDPLTFVVFATAHDQYMSDAFELYAFDYLLKPFRVERVLKTLSLIRERSEAPEPAAQPPARAARPVETKRLMIRHRDGVSFVDTDDILLVQREERMTVIYAEGERRFVTGEALGDLEARLPEAVFFRCHKSYIVNINHIDSVTPYGRWTFIIKMRGTKRDALITKERFETLETLFA